MEPLKKYAANPYPKSPKMITKAANLLQVAHAYKADALKKECTNIVLRNMSIVMETSEWKNIQKHPNLVVELFEKFVKSKRSGKSRIKI